MTGGKLLLRSLTPNKPDRNTVFKTIMSTLKPPLTALKDTHSGYNAFTEFDHEIDQLLTAKTIKKLNDIVLDASMPPKVKARRSVICRNIDSYVGSNSKEEILKNINESNQNLQAVEVYKFGDLTHIMKVRFKSTEQCDQAKEKRISMP